MKALLLSVCFVAIFLLAGCTQPSPKDDDLPPPPPDSETGSSATPWHFTSDAKPAEEEMPASGSAGKDMPPPPPA